MKPEKVLFLEMVFVYQERYVNSITDINHLYEFYSYY